MRILIVDDNIALQEILTEVVSEVGHSAKAVSTTESAFSSIESFRPEVVFLDIDMPNGLSLLDNMQNSTPPVDVPVVVIRSWNRQIPQDISMIKCHIEKPFTSYDVLNSITKAHTKDSETDEHANAAAKQTEPNKKTETLAETGVSFGKSYVIFQHGPSAVNSLISKFDKEGYNLLIITARKKKTIMERFRNEKIASLTLTIKLLGGNFNIYGLGTMIDNVDEFIKNSSRPVIAFDDLNRIIDRNGMNSALTAIYQLVTKRYGKDATFLVSVDPVGFTTKDKEILLNHMQQYHDPVGE